MSELEALSTLLSRDPVLAYSLLAALFLALVSLATGLARGDVAALARPGVLLRVALAVALAFGLALLTEAVTRTLWAEGGSWSLTGLRRFPLYLMALAYGPSIGLVAALLFAAFDSGGNLPGWPEAILGLELMAIGWLSIYPTPRRNRFAGPVNVLVGYALAWGTAGLALLEYRTGTVTGSGIWQQHQAAFLGLGLCALLLALIGPGSYRALFPHSHIAPPGPAPDAPAVSQIEVAPLEQQGPRHGPSLTMPDLPQRYRRRGRSRELEPLPFDLEDDT